jgi:hypothetical protein
MPAAMKAQTERWRQTAQRYETEPETGEGRKELMARVGAAFTILAFVAPTPMHL